MLRESWRTEIIERGGEFGERGADDSFARDAANLSAHVDYQVIDF